MPNICLYLQLHQPYRLSPINVFDLGQSEPNYFADQSTNADATTDANAIIFSKVAQKSYLPMLNLLLALTRQQPKFVFSLSCSGVFLDQAMIYQPKIIDLIKQLVDTGQVEILAETYYHSLASLYSPKEFVDQVKQHQIKIDQLFGVKPKVFRNTELIYSNQIGQMVTEMGYLGMLTEAVDRYLGGHTRTQIFHSQTHGKALPLLLKHAQFSDDIAFRFSDRNWSWYPLTVDRYLDWVEVYPESDYVNLFMDFETFGEHQWADTGVFEFFADFVVKFLQKDWNAFVNPSQAFIHHHQRVQDLTIDPPVYDVPEPISWADVDRDLTAWQDNELQQDTLRVIYQMQDRVLASGDRGLIEDWRKLQTSDHFYYMCTKWAADGDVHAYFSPYDSPLEAYRRYSLVLADLSERLL